MQGERGVAVAAVGRPVCRYRSGEAWRPRNRDVSDRRENGQGMDWTRNVYGGAQGEHGRIDRSGREECANLSGSGEVPKRRSSVPESGAVRAQRRNPMVEVAD